MVGYNSKKLSPAAIRYSISEHELCGLAVNIHSFKHILRNTDFTVIIDHSALLYILHAKREPLILRLKKRIEVLSQYSFKVKFLRGKDMKFLICCQGIQARTWLLQMKYFLFPLKARNY